MRCEGLCPVAPAGDLKMFSTGCKKSRFNCFERDGQKACSIIFRVMHFYGPPCSFLRPPPDRYTKQIQVGFKMLYLACRVTEWAPAPDLFSAVAFCLLLMRIQSFPLKAKVPFKLGGQKVFFCVCLRNNRRASEAASQYLVSAVAKNDGNQQTVSVSRLNGEE